MGRLFLYFKIGLYSSSFDQVFAKANRWFAKVSSHKHPYGQERDSAQICGGIHAVRTSC